MKKFWDFKKKGKEGELYLYGEIASSSWWGDEITPKTFKDDLDALGDINTLHVYINSPGGDVFAGWAIINIMQRHKAQKVGYNDGLAASIAFDIYQAMDKRIAAKNSMFMTHNCWTVTAGNRHDLRKQADEMEKIDGMLAETAAAKSGKAVDEIMALQDAETWYTADEAKEAGFADEIAGEKKIAACVVPEVMARYKNPPKLKNAVQAVEVVYGPPCSGKSTYVNGKAGSDDLIYDYDKLVSAMTTRSERGTEKTVAHKIAVDVRGLVVDYAKGESQTATAYIITSWPSDALMDSLEGLTVEKKRMEASLDECIERLAVDETRPDKDGWKQIINDWFDKHAADGIFTPEQQGKEPVSDMDTQKRRFADTNRKFIIAEVKR